MIKPLQLFMIIGLLLLASCGSVESPQAIAGSLASRPEQALVRRAFYITRHGQTDQNVLKIVGDERAQLTEAGKQSAVSLSDTLYVLFSHPDSRVYLVSSNLARAKETARLIGRNSIKVIADSRLNERVSGKLATMPAEEVGKLLTLLESNHLEHYLALMGTESAESHITRTREAINYHLSHAPKSKTPVFVSHLKSMLEIAYLAGFETQHFDNTTLYYFEPCAVENWAVSRVFLDNYGIQRNVIQSCPTTL